MSPSERAEKLKILTTEGEPEWLKLAKKEAKETMEKMKEQMKEKDGGQDKYLLKQGSKKPLRKVQQDSSPPIALISDVESKLSEFQGPLATRVKARVTGLKTKWASLSDGEEPKSMDAIVREQIDSALEKYRDESLIDKAVGLVSAFQHSKAYLDGAALSGQPLSEMEALMASTRVPMTLGVAFMGELARVIVRLSTGNQVKDAQKCITYTELYVKLAGLKDMMLTQMISLSPSSLQNDINGLMAHRQNIGEATKVLLQPFYTIDFGSKILPYFDPDISVITDSFAIAVLGLGKYDRSMAGYYCLASYHGNSRPKDLVWSRHIEQLRLHDGIPYTKTTTMNNRNCYWKLVPHGNHTFSIVNKKDCDRKDARCGWMLSWDRVDSKGYVNIDKDDPNLWEIDGNDELKRYVFFVIKYSASVIEFSGY
ncbi:hypothetical protein QZH41_001301 [Actinostola sp. cb2023]|nr:hypothetical protein QZH41_001301 [Actinostola sp. cb2023]